MNVQKLESERMELINDLIALSQIMDDYYRFHPNNPNRIDLVEAYDNLVEMKKEIDINLEEIEIELGIIG